MTKQLIYPHLTREKLLNLAGEKFFTRGEDYHKRGLVDLVYHADDAALAKVYGTHVYLVEFGFDEDGFKADCTCPAMEDWHSCKHIVAAGLAVGSKAGKPTHAVGTRAAAQQSLPFEAKYPNLANWVKDGVIEIGRTHYSKSIVRVMAEDDMVWESYARYPSLDHALTAADQAVSQWIKDN